MNRRVLVSTTILLCLFQLCIAGEGFWETHGPYGGEVWTVEYGGGTRGLCYTGGLGGIFTSFDDGIAWENRTPDLPLDPSDTYCYHLSACPAQTGLVYAVFADYYGYYYSAVLKSADAGATWEELASPAQTYAISALACDPNDPNRVYVAYSEGGG